MIVYFTIFIYYFNSGLNEISASSGSCATWWKRVPGEGILRAQKWWIGEADGGFEFVGFGRR